MTDTLMISTPTIVVSAPIESANETWNSVTLFNLAEAELLLDKIERDGFPEMQFKVIGTSQFVITWR